MQETVRHLWFEQAMLPQGWARDVRIGIEEGRIASVEARTRPLPADEILGVAIPGLCNVHSHGFQRGMAGLSERRNASNDDFWSWREIMYRFLDRLSPEDLAAISAQAYVEMLERGFTRVGEFHYLHNDVGGRPYSDPAEMAGAIIAAADVAGIGLTFLPVFYAHSDFGGASPAPGQRRFVSKVDGFAALFEASRSKLPADAVLGIAPHSLRAITPRELRAILPLAPSGPIHIHAAEQQKEVDACVAWSGARPVEWLLANEDVDRRWCLIHATHIDARETNGLAASHAVAGLCPITEANLGDGTFPAIRYLNAHGRFAVGTDSNVLIDAPGELRSLEYSQRLTQKRRALLADDTLTSVGERLYRAALAGGGQALGVETGLEVGKSADIVSLDRNHPSLVGAEEEQILDRWIFATHAGAVDSVWRGGRKQVERGRHFAGERVAERYRRTMKSLLG